MTISEKQIEAAQSVHPVIAFGNVYTGWAAGEFPEDGTGFRPMTPYGSQDAAIEFADRETTRRRLEAALSA